MSLPPLTKTYATRRNVPYVVETTQSEIRRVAIWSLKAHLRDQIVTGTMSGTRHANSIWTCYYSCDGTTAGTAGDGVDRWTTYANVVQNTSGSAHSWIVLYNSDFGIYCILDANSTTNGLRFTFTKTAPTGGTTTTGPTATNAWIPTTSDGTSSSVTIIGDDVVATTHYTHFVTTSDGSFIFLCSRSGVNSFTTFASLTRSVGAHVNDTNNYFACARGAISARGVPDYSSLISNGQFQSRSPNGTVVPTSGGASSVQFGGAAWPASAGIDSLTSTWPAFPIGVASLQTGHIAYRGTIPDWYWVATATVGSSIPSAANQERVVAGDIIIPFVGGAPIL